MWVFEISSSSFIPSQRASPLHSISNFCPIVGWKAEHILWGFCSYPEFLYTSAHTFGRADPWRGGVKRSPHKHLCVSEIGGDESGRMRPEQEARMKQLRGWRRWLLRASLRERGAWNKMMDFFFFVVQQSLFTYTQTYQSFPPVCGYFQSLLLLPLGAHRPTPLFVLSSLLYSFSPVLSLHFHLLQQSCDWRTLSTNDPISSLFIDFRALSLSSPPPVRPPHHSVVSQPPLLFTSLFHTFCLAFKSPF